MPLGSFFGVNGTISRKPHPYKMPAWQYYKYFNKMNKKVDFIVTHETPRFFIGTEEYIGKDDLYQSILRLNPKIYIYGHCHHRKYHTIHKGIHFLNVDARVLIINPPYDIDFNVNKKEKVVGKEYDNIEPPIPLSEMSKSARKIWYKKLRKIKQLN
jgi:hypothetical protein